MDPRREGAMETLRAIDQATARIDALIERAGSPVMIVKNNEQYSASARMAEIDKRARMMAHQLNSPKYECTISIMSDEIIAQDAKLRDMANIIDRMEAALHNVINERDQLMKDMKKLVFRHGDCFACKHLTDGIIECCVHCNPKDNQSQWEWRGVPDKEE